MPANGCMRARIMYMHMQRRRDAHKRERFSFFSYVDGYGGVGLQWFAVRGAFGCSYFYNYELQLICSLYNLMRFASFLMWLRISVRSRCALLHSFSIIIVY